jgi:hypothetical protein
MVSTMYQPETEELAPLGDCILKECYIFQTKWARALKIDSLG